MKTSVLAKIAAGVIRSRFGNLDYYCQHHLHLSESDYLAFEHGTFELTNSQYQILRSLFTDYEWMLVQKIAFQQARIPEADQTIENFYNHAKSAIAKQWLLTNNCETVFSTEKTEHGTKSHLQLKMTYELWGFDDILDFVVPDKVKMQIETKKLDLLTWAAQLNPNE